MALRIISGGLKTSDAPSSLKIISGGLKTAAPAVSTVSDLSPDNQPPSKLTIISGGPKETAPFNGKVSGRNLFNPLLEAAQNPAALGVRLAEKFTGQSLIPKIPNDPSQLMDAPLSAIRGAVSAQKPVVENGDLNILKTAGLSGLEGIIHPQAIPAFGAQIQNAYPATNPWVSGAAGTALDLGILHSIGKGIPSEGKTLTEQITDELKQTFGDQKAARIEQIRQNTKGMDFRTEIQDTIDAVKEKNPNITDAEIGALKGKLGSFVGKLGKDISQGEPTPVTERVFKPGGLKEFVLGEGTTAQGENAQPPLKLEVPQGTSSTGEMLPAKPDITLGPGGGIFRGKAIQPVTEPGIGGPLATLKSMVGITPQAPQQAPAVGPIQTPVFTGKAPRQATKPTGRTLLGYIKRTYGGVDPASVTDFNVKEDFKQSGLLGILSSKGGHFSRIADDMASSGLLPGYTEGMNAQDVLMQALKEKGKLGGEGFDEKAQEKKLQTQEAQAAEDAMAPYQSLIGELVQKGYSPDSIRALIQEGQTPASPHPADLPGAESEPSPGAEIPRGNQPKLTAHEQAIAGYAEAAKKKIEAFKAEGTIAPASKFTGQAKQQMFLHYGTKEVPINSVKEASDYWHQVRDTAMKQGLGPRDMESEPMILDGQGKILGFVSWNGEVWRGEPGARGVPGSEKWTDTQEKQSMIPGTEAKFPEQPIRPQDKNLIQETGKPGELFQEKQDKTNTPEFKNWFGDSKIKDEKGQPLVVYHGTGNTKNILEGGGFNQDFIDIGNTSYGSGFYFTSKPETAEGYTKHRLEPSLEKPGGETSPGVIDAHLSIKKPIVIDGMKNARDQMPEFSRDQIKKIILAAPEIKNPDGPLSNWGDVRTDGFNKIFNEAVNAYSDYPSFFALQNDFYQGQAPEYLKTINKVTGYDGVQINFPTGEKHFVAWFPEQIKSATSNKGTFDKNNPNILYQEKSDTFFSHLERTIQEKMPNSASPEQVRGILNNSGVKKEEMDWLDVEGFLAGKDKVSKSELLDYIKSNDVKVEEVVNGQKENNLEAIAQELFGKTFRSLTRQEAPVVRSEFENRGGDLSKPTDETKFASYQLPGGENYKELLLTLPPSFKAATPADIEFVKHPGKSYHTYDVMINGEKYTDFTMPVESPELTKQDLVDEKKRYADIYNGGMAKDKSKQFTSSHFDEPNVLAHIRMNDRSNAQYKKILNIEEIQSDRKVQMEAAKARGDMAEVERLRKMMPFADKYYELAWKRILRYAVENGYDAITFTTGEQQADRYDLSKQVDSIVYTKRDNGTYGVSMMKDGQMIEGKPEIPEADLEKFVGKELAQRIIEGRGTKYPKVIGTKVLKGVDLKVGGEGKKRLYDEIFVQFLNKYTKKWGGRVGTTTVSEEPKQANDPNGLFNKAGFKVHSLEITPSMEAAVMGGQPLFNEEAGKESTFKVESEKVQKLLDKHGIKDVVIKLVDAIETPSGRGAHGSYIPAQKLVKLTAKPTLTTGYHEAYHALIRETGMNAQAQEVFKELQDQGYAESELAAEELTADAFAAYAGGRDDPKWSSKLKEFLRNLWEQIKKLFGREDIARAMFKDLYEGKAPEKFNGRAAPESSLFQEKQNKFAFEPEQPGKLAEKLSRRVGYNFEQSEKIIALAKEKGLILPGKEGRLFGLINYYKGSTFDELREYISQLDGNPQNRPAIFKLYGDIKKDAEVMKLIHQVSNEWTDINKAETFTLDPVRIIEKVTGQDLWENNILADNTFQVIAGADASMFDRLQKEITELDQNRQGIRKNSKQDAELMRKYENGISDPTVKFTEQEKKVIQFLRRKLDSLIVEANTMREILGKNKIPYKANYLPHISEQNILMDFMKENRGEQIPDITNQQWDAMRKGDFTKGNMPFNRFALKRRGFFSHLAAIGNYEYYLKTILREIYLGPAITHARKFIEYAVLKQPNAYKALDRMLNDVKGKPSIMDQNLIGLVAGNKQVRMVRSLLAKSALFGNLNFYAMNSSNFAISYDELGNYLNKGLLKFLMDKEFRTFAFKNSLMLKGRSVDPDIDPSAMKTLEQALNEVTKLLEFNNVGSTWAGAYIKGIDLGYGQGKAIKYADAIARRTQVGYKNYEVNAFMRSNSGKLLAQFQTWSFNAMNHILYDVGVAKIGNKFRGKTKPNDKTRWGAFFGLLTVAIIFNSIYKALGLRAPYDLTSAIPFSGGGKYQGPPIARLAADIGEIATSKKPDTRQRAALRAGLSVVPAGRQLYRFSQGQVFPKSERPSAQPKTGVFSGKKSNNIFSGKKKGIF